LLDKIFSAGTLPNKTNFQAEHESNRRKKIRSEAEAPLVAMHASVNVHALTNVHIKLMSNPRVMRLSSLTCTPFLMRSFQPKNVNK
jgi:hypothetical protein